VKHRPYPLIAVASLALLPGCWNLFSLLPPLPSSECETFVDITSLVATDAGTALVTFGCNQGSASACDGGIAADCDPIACIEVDWVGVEQSFNGNCSEAQAQGLATAASCTLLPGDAGVTLAFAAPAAVPAPAIVFAHLADGGFQSTCNAGCAESAVTCTCDAALSGTQNQSCTALQ